MLRLLLRPVRLGSLFGIPVLVMPAVLVMIVLMVAWAGKRAGAVGAGWLLVMLLILAISLVAHELGHALVARRLGLRVLDITIWPLGGMARLEGMADRPRHEGPVALAGPAVNLVLAGGLALVPGSLAFQAMAINLVLGVGNLLPAFPLDGGRLLRAWLARRSPLVDGTRAAVSVANVLALVLLAVALWGDAFLMGLLLALYVWWAARMELVQVILRTGRMPTLRTSEVFARAFRRPAARSGRPPSDVVDAEVEDPRRSASGMDIQDLESFRGSLREFFRRHSQS